MTLKNSLAAKPTNQTVLEQLGNEEAAQSAAAGRKRKSTDEAKAKKKKEKKSTADRREELLKQLQAVENAIAKKRTKMGD